MNYCDYCGSGYIYKKCELCDNVIYSCDCDFVCSNHDFIFSQQQQEDCIISDTLENEIRSVITKARKEIDVEDG